MILLKNNGETMDEVLHITYKSNLKSIFENLKFEINVVGTIETRRKRNKKIEVNLRGF